MLFSTKSKNMPEPLEDLESSQLSTHKSKNMPEPLESSQLSTHKSKNMPEPLRSPKLNVLHKTRIQPKMLDESSDDEVSKK